MKEIRVLRPEEIECRVQQVTAKGVILLLYKDARCDMAILDETFTPFGWKRTSQFINNKEFCTVSVKDDNGEWIDKQDCGTESNTEKEKGETSDAFKRACVNWGIGRELYTKIFIFIPATTVKDERGRFVLADKYAKFSVKNIKTDPQARKILFLEIADKNDKTVFTWENGRPPVHVDVQDEDSQEECADNYVCEVCGKPFKATTYNGKKISPKEAYEITIARSQDGVARCAACRKKEVKQ